MPKSEKAPANEDVGKGEDHANNKKVVSYPLLFAHILNKSTSIVALTTNITKLETIHRETGSGARRPDTR